MTEIWRAVPGFTGYEVSSTGRVRSYKRSAAGRLISLLPDGRGYMRVRLGDGTRMVARRVHQLVAEAFIGPRPEGREVRHLDGNGMNNIPSNLEYATAAVNQADKVLHGTHNMARKTHCRRGHLFDSGNVHLVRLRTGSIARRCRACDRDRASERRAARRVA